MEPEEKSKWDARYRDRPESWTEPDDFLVRVYGQFLVKKTPGLALDVAGGAGRNSLFLVDQGWRVDLVDISEVALALAREKLGKASLQRGQLNAQRVDLNAVRELGREKYDLIVAFYFLRRELFPALISALKPGGMLVYRTYTIDRINAPGGPIDPTYLLQPGELRQAFHSLEILHYNETKTGKAAAELVARKG